MEQITLDRKLQCYVSIDEPKTCKNLRCRHNILNTLRAIFIADDGEEKKNKVKQCPKCGYYCTSYLNYIHSWHSDFLKCINADQLPKIEDNFRKRLNVKGDGLIGFGLKTKKPRCYVYNNTTKCVKTGCGGCRN